MGVMDCQRDGYTGLAERGVISLGKVIGILDCQKYGYCRLAEK